ncbi:MAG: hypothetical protein ACU0CI_05600 [Shimia sp.]
MLPLALHGQGGLGALLFIAAHALILVPIALVVWLWPAARARLHIPSRPHAGRMAAGAVAGFVAVCLACLALTETTHPWT